jgi:WD40 repeat protein
MKRFKQMLIVCGAGLLLLGDGHPAEPPDIVWEGAWSDGIGGFTGSLYGRGIALFPDGRRMVTLGPGGIVRFWDVVEGRLIREVLDENSQRIEELTPLGLSISPDGKRIATTWNVSFSPRSQAGELQIRDENWNHIRTVRFDRVEGFRPAFSADGSVVAVEGIREGHEGSVPSQHLIRVEDGSLFKTVPSRGQALFSKDGSWLVVGGETSIAGQLSIPTTVWKWPEATLQWSRRYGVVPTGHSVSEIAISDDSSLLALIAPEENRVKLIRLEDGSLIHTFVGSQEKDPEAAFFKFLHRYSDVAFTPDNRMLAIVTDHAGPSPRRMTIVFWDLENNTEYRSFESSDYSGGTKTFLLFSPDAQLFAYHKTQGIFAVARAPGARPRLKLSRNRDNLFFSWPALVEGYTLEQTGEIGSTTWEPVNRLPVTIGNEWVLTVEPEPGARFFRLRQP